MAWTNCICSKALRAPSILEVAFAGRAKASKETPKRIEPSCPVEHWIWCIFRNECASWNGGRLDQKGSFRILRRGLVSLPMNKLGLDSSGSFWKSQKPTKASFLWALERPVYVQTKWAVNSVYKNAGVIGANPFRRVVSWDDGAQPSHQRSPKKLLTSTSDSNTVANLKVTHGKSKGR